MKLAGVTGAGALLTAASQAGAAAGDTLTVIVDGTGTSGESNFEFKVSDSVEQVYGDSVGTIDGTSVSGTVGDEIVAFQYTESVTQMSVDGPASVTFGSGLADQVPEPRQELVVRSETEISYEFTTTGRIDKLLDDGRDSAERGNDAVTQNDDGTWTATGYTGNGYGDAYAVRGDVVEFVPETGPYEVYLDGQATDAYELTGTERTANDISVFSDSEVSYEFTTTGRIEKVLDDGRASAERGNDAVTQNDDGTWTATGYTGNGYGDSFTYSGEVQAFSADTDDYTIQHNGSETDKWSLTGQEKPQIRESVVGGGEAYDGQRFSESDAQYVVTTRSDLRSAADSATSGDVIWVPGDATIDTGGENFHLDGGVTIASDRGVNGSPGGTIRYTGGGGTTRMIVGDGSNVTVTGLRLFGPRDGESPGGDAWDYNHVGFRATSSGCEVANCEIAGWAIAGVDFEASGRVHHCHIHHNAQAHMGYGVQCRGGTPVIEYCQFGRNRHCIVGQGSSGYTARFNTVTGDQRSHAFDHHGSGGDVEIHNNRFELQQDRDHASSAYRQREAAHDAHIHHNWCFHGTNRDNPEQKSNPDDGIWYVAGGNHTITDNHYGTSTPPTGVGLDLG